MKLDVSILSTDKEISPATLAGDIIPDEYLYDEHGKICFTSMLFNDHKTVTDLIQTLFQNPGSIVKIYSDYRSYVYDLTQQRERLIGEDDLDSVYEKWLVQTGRDNTMDEFGMIVDFHGYIEQDLNKKYLFLTVIERAK